MKLRSYGKINLTLDIIRRRDDGYHDLESVFQQINLYDDITILPRDDGEVLVTASDSEISGPCNICHGAALMVKDLTGLRQGVSIHINKRIPMGAGLGGGSSNAAAVLKGMNRLFRLGLELQDLMGLAGKIGMDVPFHLMGGTCLVRGRGEIVERLKPLPKRHLVIVFPGFSISTKEAYGSLYYDRIGKTKSTSAFMKGYDPVYLHNDFEHSIIPRHPEIAFIKEQLGRHSLLSGSGSCVFGIYHERKEAESRYAVLRELYDGIFLTETINKRVSFASDMGMCGGVKRALAGIENLGGSVHVLGGLVHNDHATRPLRERGIRFVNDHRSVDEGVVVISAHGAPDRTREQIIERGLTLVDLTCPVVKNLQDITKRKEREGKRVIILGDAGHPEIRGVTGNLSRFTVVQDFDDITGADRASALFVVSQTTMDEERYQRFTEMIRKLDATVESADTVCDAARKRQSSARDLALRSDLVLVIGGKVSANTKRLLDICKRNTQARMIEDESELKPEWFADIERIGITAGASTPDWIIESVERQLQLLL
ncbi:MAG TPA: 4-hydroxy-3-methylbut-2-enyl diphosphate reductase [Spirochaetota bacterium]|nr:4-hydroxy-3-methylbut-2-enyl diphosphate reductase [Spirochaetota bacterium]